MSLRELSMLLLAVLALAGPAAYAQDEASGSAGDDTAEDLDRLPLAALLIGDGNYERARTILAGVDTRDEALDRVRYHTLSGLVALNLKEHSLAVREFRSAIEAGQTEPVIWLYLAQAHFSQEQFQEALDALEQAGPETTHIPSVYLMRSQAH